MSTLPDAADRAPLPSVLTVANLVYALHAFAIVVAIAGTATIVGSFLMSLPSIAAVVLNYIQRSDARGTWVASHYRWQIRTFWFSIFWVLVAAVLFVTVIGIPFYYGIIWLLSIWLAYRIGKGWLRLRDARPMYQD